VIFAKNSVVARKLSTCIADREASKTYLARIKGHFPTEWTNESQQEMIAKAQAICKGSRLTFEANNTLLVSCPLRCLSQKDGVWECHEEGKESSTQIELIHLNKWTSLVRCKPITGRTHQIRLHLQLIGFPIANDPCYGGKLHYGESFEKKHSIAQTKEATKSVVDSQMSIDYMTPQRPDESEEEFMKRTCSWCKIGPEKAFNETQLHCSKIWLHALEYKVSNCNIYYT
jgi:tRNA pseudouridine synthase 9